MSRRKQLLVRLSAGAFALATALGATLAVSGGDAFAGTNGQEVVVYNANSPSTYVAVCGANQNNQQVCSSWGYNPRGAESSLSGWWWKGWVRIYTNAGTSYSCYVAPSMSGNWVGCSI